MWWQGAVVYQIYPRSYADSNGDGVGDLPGIASKLDYIAALGVDAIWLSPIHPSPNRDYGYDTSDYTGIHSSFGTMADFEELLRGAHARGLKVILDEALSHTSEEHAWFVESLSSRDNPKADWYVWADPKLDGTAPNNWLSVFGGPAWSYHPARRQYYFHKFLKQQPKLNWHNPDAMAAALDVLRFWFERGVDGFRLDVANSFLHDAQLRDNPPIPLDERTGHHWSHAPHLQRRIRDSNLPENQAPLDRVRALAAGYPGRWVFGEFSEEPQLLGTYAGAEHGLHSGYTFTFLEDRSFKPDVFRNYYAFVNGIEGLWPCVTFSNHDVPRPVTRWGRTGRDDALAKCALALLLALRGTVLMYQGEELGLGDTDIQRHEIRDPVGDLYFPYSKGRDGCRSPMPWDGDTPNAGFGAGTPWLPISPAHPAQSVAAQDRDPASVLAFARSMIGLRKRTPALRLGSIAFREAPAPLLAFERRHETAKVFAVFNLGREAATFSASPELYGRPFLAGEGAAWQGAQLHLAARGFALIPA